MSRFQNTLVSSVIINVQHPGKKELAEAAAWLGLGFKLVSKKKVQSLFDLSIHLTLSLLITTAGTAPSYMQVLFTSR